MRKNQKGPKEQKLIPADPRIAEQVVDYLKEQKAPLRVDAIAEATGLSAWILDKQLPHLVATGEVAQTRKGAYAVPETLGYLRGKLMGTRRGDLWFRPDGGGEDYQVAGEDAGGLNGDRALALPLSQGDRAVRVHRVLTRANDTIVGTVSIKGRNAVLMPDDARLPQDIPIDGDANGAKSGDKAVLRVTRWPDEGGLRGQIVELLGHSDSAQAGILSIVRQFHLHDEFPPQAVQEADAAAARPATAEGRLDLRNTLLVTIDGADAQDFDDAVSLEKKPDGTRRLGVHIADVSAYVKEGTALDREAYARGTSVYLPGLTLPMLPEALCNGSCSLKPDEDRLAFTLFADIDHTGKILGYELHKSIIRSQGRLVYTKVNAALAGDEAQAQAYAPYLPMLRDMLALSLELRAKREARGSIDFDLEESAIEIDADGEPTNVAPRERGVSERMIEDFMLTANECVAAYARGLELPFLYRVHEAPDAGKLEEFGTFLSNMGVRLRIPRGGVQPGTLREVLDEVHGKPEAPVVSKMLLRTMMKARYADKPLGHFGLAAEDYCHFTSPIRRYPDLEIHRILSALLSGGLKDHERERFQGAMTGVAEATSLSERAALEAERAADALMKAIYMQRFIGEEFAGVISGVNTWGFYVALPSTVEGLVHVRSLPDYFEYNPEKHCLIGERTRKTFHIGDKVNVRVESVVITDRQVNFELV